MLRQRECSIFAGCGVPLFVTGDSARLRLPGCGRARGDCHPGICCGIAQEIERNPGARPVLSVGADPSTEAVRPGRLEQLLEIDHRARLSFYRDGQPIERQAPAFLLAGPNGAVTAVLALSDFGYLDITAKSIDLEPDGAQVSAVIVIGLKRQRDW